VGSLASERLQRPSTLMEGIKGSLRIIWVCLDLGVGLMTGSTPVCWKQGSPVLPAQA
jgi:hypothetical protein